ncbi:MAG: hypothetical protein QNJ17_11635 [Desulfocapsaceae bacterium]|nr:hypothetical protein [Desulfocapsaceae bacterium]
MSNLFSLVYGNHRPETLAHGAEEMARHDVIILEEPPHPNFNDMLRGELAIEEFMLELDLEYPSFSHQQYTLLQQLFREGKTIVQIEPFVENLLEIHDFFADEHSPEELPRPSLLFDVYSREKEATAKLLQYYQCVRTNDFRIIIEAIKDFAEADAERFRLRDELRAKAILSTLPHDRSVFVEAGPMHVLLEGFLKDELPSNWQMQTMISELILLRRQGIEARLFSPGDELTMAYLRRNHQSDGLDDLLAARSLIYAKIVTKEEMADDQTLFAHALDEHRVITMVNSFSFNDCEQLFFQLRDNYTASAREVATKRYHKSIES